MALSTSFLHHCNCFCVTVLKLFAVTAGLRGIQLIQDFLPECTGASASISLQSSGGLRETVYLPYKEKSTRRCGSEKLPAGQVAHFSAATGRRALHNQTHTQTDTHYLSLHTTPLCVLTHTHFPNTGNASG